MFRRTAQKLIPSHLFVCALALSACTFSGSKSSLNPELKEPTSSGEPPHVLSDRLWRLLPSSQTSAEQFGKSRLGKQVVSLLGRPLKSSDHNILIALSQLIGAQRMVRIGQAVEARSLATSVLNTPELAVGFYRSALRFLALSDIIELTDLASEAPEQLDTPRSPHTDFNTFQNRQCATACSTVGWQTLVLVQPQLFTPTGYRRTLLSPQALKNEGMTTPRWLQKLWTSTESESSKPSVTAEPEQTANRELAQTLKLRTLADARRWNEAYTLASKISAEKESIKESKRQESGCRAAYIYSQMVLAQSFRMRQDRKQFAAYQDKFMQALDSSTCTASDFGMESDRFESFRLDGRLWLARLEWEQNKNPQAFHTARQALNQALTLQSWEHYYDAAKILVGRIGFEMLNPSENIALLASLETHTPESETDEFPTWLNSRKGLIHFLEGDYNRSQKSFEKVIEKTTDNFTRAMAFYWKGRTDKAKNENTDSENSLISAGQTDPLSIYDIFSGQLMQSKSGRASTQAPRAFVGDWSAEYAAWMDVSENSPLKILSTSPVTPIVMTPKNATNEATPKSVDQFENSLQTSILLFLIHKALALESNDRDFLEMMSASNELSPELLRAEIKFLRSSFNSLTQETNEILPKAHQIAWLTNAMGDFANAILFVGRLRNTIGWDNDYLPFLYFIFYPRPYVTQFKAASEQCGVDIDLLYAISRQESLFQSSVKSPAGAIGLMQLLPSTARRILAQFPEHRDGKKINLTDPATNTLAGSCYLRDLLKRYNGNLAYAIAAYNAGEGAVDTWISRREKIPDIPYFIEFIPYAETQTYVQRVLRNYYNIKWIYQEKN